MNLLNTILHIWAMHCQFRTVLAELNSYSDRQLTGDLGLARGDIARVAYEEAERRVATSVRTRAKAPISRALVLAASH